MCTHTRSDGSFLDHKAEQVTAPYDKQIQEAMSMDDLYGPENSPNSSEQSTQQTLTLKMKNDIFVKKSYIHIHMEMEEEYGLFVSYGEVFMRTHNDTFLKFSCISCRDPGGTSSCSP